MSKRALVIGANGAIGKALLVLLSQRYSQVYAVSRTPPEQPLAKVSYHQIESTDEQAIRDWCTQLGAQNMVFETVICCIGVLHGQANGVVVTPEKRLEDIHAAQLQAYFQVNTIAPAIWLTCLPLLMKHTEPGFLVFISARVGSISDNQLGGWYGYRASKAALNMLLKSAQVELQRRAKNIVLVSYHPVTVDSSLSQPFQTNVPADKLFRPQFSAAQLLQHLPTLAAEDGPHYLDWQGLPIAW